MSFHTQLTRSGTLCPADQIMLPPAFFFNLAAAGQEQRCCHLQFPATDTFLCKTIWSLPEKVSVVFAVTQQALSHYHTNYLNDPERKKLIGQTELIKKVNL